MGPEEEIVYCILTVHCMYCTIVDILYIVIILYWARSEVDKAKWLWQHKMCWWTVDTYLFVAAWWRITVVASCCLYSILYYGDNGGAAELGVAPLCSGIAWILWAAAARRNWREEESSYKLQRTLSSLVWLTNSFVFPFQLKLLHTIEQNKI